MRQKTDVITLVKQPIYQQMNQLLRSMIAESYHVGDRFLTEREIAERFEVSRATANKALASLVSEGLLAFKKGVGTFVKGRSLDHDLRALVSFTEEALTAGKRPSTLVLRFETLSAGEAGKRIPALLSVSPDEQVYYTERLRIADSVPLILEKRHIVARYCPGLGRADLAGSIYALWSEKYSLRLEGAEQTIRAVNIRGGDADALAVKVGSAGLLITAVGRLTGGLPLWFEQTLYRGDAYEFRNSLGGVRMPSEPLLGRFLDLSVSVARTP